MAFYKLVFLLILIIMLQHRGIIYRASKEAAVRRELRELGESTLPKSSNVLGSWRMYGVNEVDPIATGPEGNTLENTPMSKKELFISFFPDGSFTQVRDNNAYSTGKWAFDSTSQSVFLTSERVTQEVGISFEIAENGLRVMHFEFNPKESMLLMEYGKPLSNYREDPFFAGNNEWRIKPEKPENKGQLQKRLSNYLLHNIYLLKAAKTREQNRVSWEFSEGILRIYNPGIGVVKPSQVPAPWINAFYSEQNAREAFNMFEDFMKKSKFKGSGKGNWVEQNNQILTDIRNGIKTPGP
ncbi:hypothetical protein DYBT9623_01478 [Dyadobacter sp. CECT 9623]|uniref:Uncharacterized protein n=1 Tax=Dyadobacter linearis TaxID=2823330 RepID=A0ABM8UMW2_9BACT|nr:hypothetical protein [Dyadobacter sp. CECT 9623]CAG5068746.1 hypothetical protein DYBT9623_01478 [Dyadobacter sp. CECT 9623]